MILRATRLTLSLALVLSLALPAPAVLAAAADDAAAGTGSLPGAVAPAAPVAPPAPAVPAVPADSSAPAAVVPPGPQPAPAAATSASGPVVPLDGDEVLVSAEHLERSGETRTLTGEGAVVVRHRDMRLVADRVVYNELTKEVVADGNVVLDSGMDRLQGSHLELNLETRIGFLENAQGFLQTYYFTGERLEKRGPDHYYLRGGSFTTCEGVLPDWSFHATSTEVTIDEYLYAWNPTLRIKKLPIFYLPYAVFPVKRDRSTGLLIPVISIRGADGFTLRNAFYWAPRDTYDATIGLDYLEKTGWGASGEVRYLLAPRTQGVTSAYYLRNTTLDSERWLLQTRNSHELPLGIHAEIEAFFQSDREFISTQGRTIEDRSSERTTASFFLSRTWSAWNFALSGRDEISLLTESRTTLTRFPELTIDRTSTRLFGTDLFLKVAASGAVLKRDDSTTAFSTTRLHVSPEMTWPVSIGSVARIIPLAGYALTNYSENTLGTDETRSIPFFKLTLEGPRPYRIWDLSSGGRFTRLKHLIEPRVSYVYTPEVNQDTLPQFDGVDRIPQANRVEYSLINTLFAKVRPASGAVSSAVPSAVPAAAATAVPIAVPISVTTELPAVEPATQTPPPAAALAPDATGTASATPADPAATAATAATGEPAVQLSTTQELLWVKLSQSYTIDSGTAADTGEPFSAVEWEARTRPLSGLEVQWRGNFDAYGSGIGYQNLSLNWKATNSSTLQADWRSTSGSNQDFLDLGGNIWLGRVNVQGRSRYNLAEDTFVENRIVLKYNAQCWDITLGYVKWTTEYEYSITFSLKGIGTIVKI